jgi:hypothetical protein
MLYYNELLSAFSLIDTNIHLTTLFSNTKQSVRRQ